MISKIHVIIRKIRHARGFRRLSLLWGLFRPIYFWLVTFFAAKRGLLTTIGGHSIRIDPIFAWRNWGIYESKTCKVFSAEIKPGDVFYDVGAHMGIYTAIFFQHSGAAGKAVCYEPDNHIFDILKKVVVWNNCESRSILRNAACGAISGDADFYCWQGKTNMNLGRDSLLPIEGFEKRITFTTTIDAEVNKLGLIPSIIKIDVEGAEWNVLKGAELTLYRYRPRIFLSLHPSLLAKSGTTPAAVLGWLTEKGYSWEIIGYDHEMHVFARCPKHAFITNKESEKKVNKKVCLIISGHISTTPRAVKEADALTEIGYDVEVIGMFHVLEAIKTDEKLLKSRIWKYTCTGGTPTTNRWRYWQARLYRGLARRWVQNSILSTPPILAKWAISNVTPELIKATKSIKADLYIVHNLGILPTVAKMAKKHNAKLGFDAEDFHSAELMPNKKNNRITKLCESIERKQLPLCDYITVSSESIADAYVAKYGIKKPEAILNVFPVSMKSEKTKEKKEDHLSLYWISQTIGLDRGLEDAIRAMGRISKDVRLYLQGCISKKCKEVLLNLALENELKTNKIIFLETIFLGNIINVASQYDVGLALEQSQSLYRDLCVSNKIFTYLLAGLSIIATDTKGQKLIIQSIGKAGWLYKHGDIDALSERLEFLASNKAYLEESKKEALRYAYEKYNWDLEKKKYLRIIKKIL